IGIPFTARIEVVHAEADVGHHALELEFGLPVERALYRRAFPNPDRVCVVRVSRVNLAEVDVVVAVDVLDTGLDLHEPVELARQVEAAGPLCNFGAVASAEPVATVAELDAQLVERVPPLPSEGLFRQLDRADRLEDRGVSLHVTHGVGEVVRAGP